MRLGLIEPFRDNIKCFKLTELGHKVVKLPLDVEEALTIVHALEYGRGALAQAII